MAQRDAIVERDVPVEMRDGVELAADVYHPPDAESNGTPVLLQRTPYNKSNAWIAGGMIFNPLTAVDRGYTVVVQDSRGRFASDGDFDPLRDEMDDGYDTVEWAADQPWSNGSVGVYGSSYMGVTAWHAAVADPPHLEAVMAFLTGANYHDGWAYTGGAFELGFNLRWTIFSLMSDIYGNAKEDLLDHAEEIESVMKHLPLDDLPPLPEVAPFYMDWLDHPAYDDYWREIDVTRRVDDIQVPVMSVTGWYDNFLKGHLDMYEAIDDAGSETTRDSHRLVVGPWDHEAYISISPSTVGDEVFGPRAASGVGLFGDMAFEWFDHWLKGEGSIDGPRFRYYQIGDDEWRNAAQWPPDHTPTRYYLHSDGAANSRFGDGTLTRTPCGAETPDSYAYDPEDPVPTVGGRLEMPQIQESGIKDQSGVEERDDVLVYTTPRLPEAVEIAGPIELTLYAATSAPDTDFTGKLVDVRPNGYCAIVSEGIVRGRYRNDRTAAEFLDPGTVYEFDVDLWASAYTFDPGHRIRLEVTSSNFPRFNRNLNSETAPETGTLEDAQVAVQQVHHDEEYPSHVTLPVVE